MSTHKSQCLVCDKDVYCCNDAESIWGISGCYDFAPFKKAISFCSKHCFMLLFEEMRMREPIAQSLQDELDANGILGYTEGWTGVNKS